MNILDKALEIANFAHKGQKRKYFNIPYITHPLEVMKRICVWGIDDEEILSTAVLHDSIEDTVGHKQTVIARQIQDLGGSIYKWVSDLTVYNGIKKEDYIKTFADKSAEVLIVKLADRVCNLNDFWLENPDGYFGKYYQKSIPLFKIYEDRADEVYSYFKNENIVHKIDKDLFKLKKKYSNGF